MNRSGYSIITIATLMLVGSLAYSGGNRESRLRAPKPAPQTLAQGAARTAHEVRIWREANETRVIDELRAFLSIPNFASDTANIQRNADKLEDMLKARGFETELLRITNRGPVVFGKLEVPGAERTIIFYMHYDGQSVDPATWTGTRPYEPALRNAPLELNGDIISFPEGSERYQDDWRLYARSAADDKSPIIALLAAIDALRAQKIPLGVNVKVVFDGEEEGGSPNLERTFMAHRDLFSGDLLINGDGPVHQSGRMMVTFGNRGIVSAQITVYGPLRPLHSGHYGNWAPNPAMRLAQLLATMKDDNGNVRIKEFYDGIASLGSTEQEALKEMPNNDAELEKEFAIAEPDGAGKRLVELLTQPSLNVDGLRSADVDDQSRTVIPDQATAAIDMRLVKNITPQMQFDRLVAHIRAQGYFVTAEEPTENARRTHAKVARVVMSKGAYPASMTSMDLPVSKALADVVDAAAGGGLVKTPILGGSVPMYIFENLKLPVIGVPIVNYDDNQHSPNENLRIGHFWRGIEVYAAILANLKWE
ncbi:MAG TPA: M20/M25/M40 family metallo-hydrolase [Candidatus Acidoferrum sp.]|nr:M20/M25/M40 family metallo-hydrolase [Candidatus Acidoferrum sp.]